MSMLEPNENIILWNQIIALPMNANAKAYKRNVRGWNARNKNMRNANKRAYNNNEIKSSTSHSTRNNKGEEAMRKLQEQVVEQ